MILGQMNSPSTRTFTARSAKKWTATQRKLAYHLDVRAFGLSLNIAMSWVTGYPLNIDSNSGRKRQKASRLPLGRNQMRNPANISAAWLDIRFTFFMSISTRRLV